MILLIFQIFRIVVFKIFLLDQLLRLFQIFTSFWRRRCWLLINCIVCCLIWSSLLRGIFLLWSYNCLIHIPPIRYYFVPIFVKINILSVWDVLTLISIFQRLSWFCMASLIFLTCSFNLLHVQFQVDNSRFKFLS